MRFLSTTVISFKFTGRSINTNIFVLNPYPSSISKFDIMEFILPNADVFASPKLAIADVL